MWTVAQIHPGIISQGVQEAEDQEGQSEEEDNRAPLRSERELGLLRKQTIVKPRGRK